LWKPENLVELVDGVPLTRIKYDEKGLPELSEEESQVPISRPLAKPRIASGATIPGNTVWEEWKEEGLENPVGVQTKIDTSAAGFTETPCYFAWLQQGSLWNRIDQNLYLAHVENIQDPTPTNFIFRILILPIYVGREKLVRFQENIRNIFLESSKEHKLYVSWLGIQPIKENL